MAIQGEALKGEILFEFVQLGGQMRVAAIHVDTGTEVVIIAPLSASQRQMQQIALAKLKRRVEMTRAGGN